MTTTAASASTATAAIDLVLRDGLVRSAYQPIVNLHDGEVVGFEALARGVPGSPLESPAELFPAAREAGLLGELDRLCTRRAIEGALGRLDGGLCLFINVEPEVAPQFLPDVMDLLESTRGTRVVVELTERALTDRPAELLALVRDVRARGWGISLDDVGADSRSLALMSLLDPDVIKLDLSLVQQRANADIAAIVAAVSAYAERSGAVVLAEGIETDEHLQVALSMGATLGQGWKFGRPEPLPAQTHGPRQPLRLSAGTDLLPTSPFAAATEGCDFLRSNKRLLIEISKHLEQEALALGPTAVVLAAFQHSDFFTPATSARYTELAQRAALVGALGEGMSLTPAPGVRGAPLAMDDPILSEWDIAVISPHFAAALVARDRGRDATDSRQFDYLLTYDRAKATLVAKSLMERFVSLI